MARALPAAAAFLVLTLTWPLASQTVIEDFEDGQNEHAWVLGFACNSVELGGGNPGRFLRDACLLDFAPQPRTLSPGFNGNYRERGITAIEIDLITFASSDVIDRPLTIMLYQDNGTPGLPTDDWIAYFVGSTLVPMPAEGWRSFQFPIDSQTSALPAGWDFLVFDPNQSNPDWSTLMENVTELRFFYGAPSTLYPDGLWDIGMDNARILAADGEFRRGDANGDGAFQGLVDAFFILAFQFIPGSPQPPCFDAADVNDDGTINGLVDGVAALNFQFIPGSPPPADPGPLACGPDPTLDPLDCATSACP